MSAETIAGGRYQVERVLGEGAMATVVCAQDQELDRLVAVKLLDERLAADETFRAPKDRSRPRRCAGSAWRSPPG